MEGTECTNGLKKCGTVCVPTTKDCPLSDLIHTTSVDDSENYIKIGDNHYLKKFHDSEAIISL